MIEMGTFGIYQSSLSLGNVFKEDYNSLFNYICFLYSVLAGRCVYPCNSSTLGGHQCRQGCMVRPTL